jgi:hypothetical protein
MANQLNDGNPLTYDWLNSLVTELNSVKSTQNKYTGSTKISVIADHLTTRAGTATIQFLTGQAIVPINKGESFNSTLVKFAYTFASPDVMVIANINYPNAAEDIIATACATNINESGCTIKVNRFPPIDKKKQTPIRVSYIAIGKAKQVS